MTLLECQLHLLGCESPHWQPAGATLGQAVQLGGVQGDPHPESYGPVKVAKMFIAEGFYKIWI